MSTVICPHCGGVVDVKVSVAPVEAIIGEANELLAFLRADPRREVYETQRAGVFAIAYSHGKLANRSAIDQLLAHGHLKLKWPSEPRALCWVLTPARASEARG